MAESERDRSRALDEHLIAYLSAYEDYTTLHVEMETQLKDGYLSLSRAKRDLLRSSSLGQELYPREIDPLIVVAEEPAETEGEAVTLCYQFCVEGAFVIDREDAQDAEAAVEEGGATGDAAERDAMAALARMGLSPEMQREIAAAVRDDGEDIGVAVGDTITIDDVSGKAEKVHTRAPTSFAASGLDDLKRAQFRAALESDDDYAAVRPKPLKPSAKRDPLRWFTLLPPPSLRQSQKSFRRGAETAVALAAAQAKMHAARERYEALQQQVAAATS